MKNVEPDPAVVEAAAGSHARGDEGARGDADRASRLRDDPRGSHRGLRHARLAAPRAACGRAAPISRSPRSWRSSRSTWPAGPLTLRQVWEFYPYENSLVTVKATGKLVRAGPRARGRLSGGPAERLRDCDSLEGAEYKLDFSKPAGQRVVSLTRGGREIAADDVFTVALNSYRASGGGGYPMWKRAERVREKGNVREMLAADALSAKRLDLTPTKNWSATR